MASLPHPRSLHTIRLRGYGKDAIHEVCIQLDCVGMARMPYPPTKKLLQMFCRSFLCLYMFFIDFRVRPYSLSSTSLMRSSMWLL